MSIEDLTDSIPNNVSTFEKDSFVDQNNVQSIVSTQLKVGDKIYIKSRLNGIIAVITIEKTTPTQAVSGEIRFKINLINGNRVERIGDVTPAFDKIYYYLETDELKMEFFRQSAISKLKNFPYKNLSNETLEILVTAIKGK